MRTPLTNLTFAHDTAFEAVKPEDFTGEAWIAALAHAPEKGGLRIPLVDFAARTRTDWHTHTFVQHLVVVAGEAIVEIEGEQPHLLRVGESAIIPPDRKHWHGAGPDGPMCHLAVNFAGGSDWSLPPVSEEDYASAITRIGKGS